MVVPGLKVPDLLWPFWVEVQNMGFGIDDFDTGMYKFFKKNIAQPLESPKYGALQKHLASAKIIMDMCCVDINKRPTAENIKCRING